MVLLALGTALTMAYGDVIILAYYGVYFLLSLPLVRLGAGTLAVIAAGLALVTPQLAFAPELAAERVRPAEHQRLRPEAPSGLPPAGGPGRHR